ncbi:MAG: polyribonucleotide nucleotidyltransferase, partial [Thermoleophilia bacterium]|nr:polyribonucleotide nucleotidyltransferase [Thermoleophilia bacterium]
MSRFDERRVAVQIGETEISFTTGKLAKQAGGSVLVQAGDTVVLATATAGGERDIDFLPLTVDVEERMYATGKIPGSFFKREGRSGEKATLVCRMIDRPLRPLFPNGWHRDTQIVATPLSIDHINPYDVLAMNGASAALMISDIPFDTPVGAVRIGLVEGNFVVNPAEESLLTEGESDLDLVVAGTEHAILMVEAGANEVTEAEILDALDIAHGEIKKLCAAQHELRELKGKEKTQVNPPQLDEALFAEIEGSHGHAMREAVTIPEKLVRYAKIDEIKAAIKAQYGPAG